MKRLLTFILFSLGAQLVYAQANTMVDLEYVTAAQKRGAILLDVRSTKDRAHIQ